MNLGGTIPFHFADEPIAGRRRFPANTASRMRAIFLDIDGVLNSSKTANPRDLPYIVDRRLLCTFRKLAARTRAKVGLAPRPRRPVQRPLLGYAIRRCRSGSAQALPRGRDPGLAEKAFGR